jgi:NAD(P)-dependent dehydrogenase (short-subunit alcohol dehydrogenase family)
MAWTAADIPDQSGRVAVVTGANGGLGLEVARELARKGGHVVMAARDQAKAEAARTSIHREVPDASLELQPLDLASQRSVREAAAQILAGQPTIDILVNNAGVMGIPERRTEDGFELQLAVNHLGHFALTALLLPALLARAGARVVSVTSTGRHAGRALDPANPHLAGGATIPGGPTGSPSWPTCTSPWSWIGACGQRGCRPGASSSIRGSPTPTCRPAACARPAVAVVSGSSAPLSSGSG